MSALGDLTNTEERECGDSGPSSRINQFKNQNKHEDARRRRTECSVELRKQKRDEQLMKRRNVTVYSDDEEAANDDADAAEGAAPGAAVGVDPTLAQAASLALSPRTASVRLTPEQIVQLLIGQPSRDQMELCFEALRRMLSRQKAPPIDHVIRVGLLDAIVQALGYPDTKIQLEAAWALTNVVSGTSEQTMAAVNAGCVGPLAALLTHEDLALVEQCIWALSNIAGDCVKFRNHIIESGAVEPLLNTLAREGVVTNESMTRTIAWGCSNLCRHKASPPPREVLGAIAMACAYILQHSTDKQTRMDTCWALSYLTDGVDEQIELAHRAGALPLVVELLKTDSDSLMAPALRVLGNVATGTDAITQLVIDAGALPVVHAIMTAQKRPSNGILKELLDLKDDGQMQESCWLLSNLLAGTNDQIWAVVEAGFLPVLARVLYEGDSKSAFEAMYAIANLCSSDSSTLPYELWKRADIFDGLVHALGYPDVNMLKNALSTLNAILEAIEARDPNELSVALERWEECGGLDKLEELQKHDNNEIYHHCVGLIRRFFEEDDEDEGNADGLEAPAANDGGYTF